MSKQFWIFLIAGVAIVGAAIGFLLLGTKGNHLEVVGDILKVRTLPMSNATIVIVPSTAVDTMQLGATVASLSTMAAAMGKTAPPLPPAPIS